MAKRGKKRGSRKAAVRQMTMPFVRVARAGKRLGRPRSKGSGVWHLRRPDVRSSVPMLVTWKLCEGLPSLRQKGEADIFFDVLRRVNGEGGIRIVHWVLLRNHMHLIVEGDDREAVLKALRGFAIALGKRWNHLWKRKGMVFADRYHRRDLESPTQVRNGLRYVFMNQAKHTRHRQYRTLHHDDGRVERVTYVDHFYSSALYFSGWKEEFLDTRPPDERCARPRSWLLRTGYKRGGGTLSVDDPLPRSA